MTLPRLTAAVGDFDRTRPIIDGRVRVEGFDIAWQSGDLESIFSRAFETAEADATELSFGNFLVATARGGCPYIGLPVFPSRSFRQHAIFIRNDRGIRTPRDLEGKRIGLREYTNTASLVARGALDTFYGVDLSRIRWVVGDIDRRERTVFPLPKLPLPFEITAEPGALLSDLLESGDLDGLISYSAPPCLGRNGVVRLFDRWWDEEARYYRETGVFPVMHLMVVKRTTLAAHPTLAPALFDAFSRAKALALADLHLEQALKVSLPWTAAHLAQTKAVMGDRFWPYGVEENRRTLEAQIGFAHRQHLIDRPVAVEELFVPALLTRRED